jgi:tRNA1Val (adenine37-N6)-methyltransferase
MQAGTEAAVETTDGHLLGGRVRYAQPRQGFRSGIEPVLLAASIPARDGQTVIEAGTGAGAALLCLAARIPGIEGTGVERDPALAALARANAAVNGYAGLHFITAAIEARPVAETFDHAFANPPYHAPGGTRSGVPAREAAKRAHVGLFADWAASLGAVLRPRGTLTLILPASAVPLALPALAAANCPAEALLPLWPKSGQAAKLVLLRGIKGGGGTLKLHPGVVLHAVDGRYTPQAEAILRHATSLEM